MTPPRVILALAAAAMSCQPALAQRLGQGSDDGISMWRVVVALILCLALAVFAAYALRARIGGLPFLSGTRQGRRMQLVETLRLSHQIDLCVVACDGQELLVAAGPQGVQLLKDLPARSPEQQI